MVVVGVDAHKASHTFVAVDAGGCRLSELTVRATTAGHTAALDWARGAFGADMLWAVEDCGICLDGWNERCSTPVNRWCGSRRT